MIWPSPEPVKLTLFAGDSNVVLPLRPRRGAPEFKDFELAEEGPPMAVSQLESRSSRNVVNRDVTTGRVDVIAERGDGLYRIEEHGLAFARDTSERMSIVEGDPLSAETEMVVRSRMRRENWSVEVIARIRLTADADHFHLEADLDVFENGTRVAARNWSTPIPRDCL